MPLDRVFFLDLERWGHLEILGFETFGEAQGSQAAR